MIGMIRNIFLAVLILFNIVSCNKNSVVEKNFAKVPEPNIVDGVDRRNLYIIDAYIVNVRPNHGYINYEGELVIPFEYPFATRFVDGVAVVKKNWEDKFGSIFINCDNQIVDGSGYSADMFYYDSIVYDEDVATEFPPEIPVPDGYFISSYLGYGYYEITKDDEWAYDCDEFTQGVIDSTGKIIFAPQKCYSFERFVNGMSRITIGPIGNNGYLRKDGKIFLATDY